MNRRARRFLKYWFPAILWGVFIFSFSSGSVASVSEVFWQDFVVHKSAHMLEFALLAILVYRGLRSAGVTATQAAFYAVLICGFYGATDEFHQMFTPGREPRVRDVFFDTIGAIGGIYIVWKLLPRAPKRLKNWGKKLDLL